MFQTLGITLLCLLIASCHTFETEGSHQQSGICKELKRRIVFNGSTSNGLKATQQRAELEQLNHNYQAQCE